jgi:uncharacterized OsmC-like protein
MKIKKLNVTVTHERLATNIDSFDDLKIKRETRWIAKAVECPIINSIHGSFLNPMCHLRCDLN